MNPDREIIDGLQFLLQAIKARQPKAEIILLGIYPRRKEEQKVAELNQEFINIAAAMNVRYLNAGRVLADGNGNIDETLFTDGLHPNAEGYKRLAKLIVPYLKPVEKAPQKLKK